MKKITIICENEKEIVKELIKLKDKHSVDQFIRFYIKDFKYLKK